MSKIVVCDDSRFIRQISDQVLTRMGHQILFKAPNGQDLLDYYELNFREVDLLLLDVVMPKMDGLQTLKKILRINPRAKVIMVTSISSQSIVQSCMRLGALDFVVKPYRLSEFARTINNVLNQKN